MSILTAIILGAIEGTTEFIPISSSGHLIIARELLGENNTFGLSFDAILQMAATLALLVYFRKDIWRLVTSFINWIYTKEIGEKDKTLLLSLILGTIPAVLIGLMLENIMGTIFRDVHLVAWSLLLGSAMFWIAEKVARENNPLSLGRGIIVGFFQCLALVPGVSRSGATISGGLISGLSKDEAVRFSFLLSIPILFGSGLKKLFEIRHEFVSSTINSQLFFGSLAAFVVALISINFLIKYLKSHGLNLFIWYRIALFIAIFLIF